MHASSDEAVAVRGVLRSVHKRHTAMSMSSLCGQAARLLKAAVVTIAASAICMGIARAQAPVTIQPPNLAGAVAGTLPGQAAVTPSGASTFSVPLAIPPGTAGLAPSVSLDYSSQSQMGLMGQGWRISGLSTISRCGKTIAQDGYAMGVKLVAADEFCLDGQRLLFVAGSGTHGANAEYRTQIDTLRRVKSFGSNTAIGPDSFRVEAMGGLIYTYGSTADATIEAAGTTVRHTWALSKVEDRRGNFYTYSYNENGTTGEYYPTQIRFTGNSTAGLAPYNAVSFVYETRPDVWTDYIVGSPFKHTMRLTAVRTNINTQADGSGGTLVRDYRVSYTTNPTNVRSLVDEIKDCDTAGNCLPGTKFTWTARAVSQNNFSATGSGVWGGPEAIYADVAHKTVWNSIAVVDMNGDGKTDLLKSFENGTWQVCLSTGSSFSCQNWSGPSKKMGEVVLGDFDGDGRTDLSHLAATGSSVCFSTGSSFNCVPAQSGIPSADTMGDYTLGWVTVHPESRTTVAVADPSLTSTVQSAGGV